MAFDIRKIFVILAVSIIFSLFSFALFDAFYPSTDYNDYCEEGPYFEINTSEVCEANGGKWTDYGAPKRVDGTLSGYCDTTFECRQAYDLSRDKRYYAGFIFLSIMGAIAIILGINLPVGKNPINEWIGTGFMLGGLFDVFIGTAMYYQELSRFARPLILFLELALVIFLAYKKLGEEHNKNSKNKKNKIFSFF